ncbi:MAG TPA: type IV toxin-antitoxin system AbiEi family antitoxin [Trueperaceae bacterium]
MDLTGEENLLDAAVNHLRKLPGAKVTMGEREAAADRTPNVKADATITLKTASGEQKYLAEVKKVDKRSLSAVLAQLVHHSQMAGLSPLLIANPISEALVDTLLREGVQFVDGAGNMYLESPAFHAVVRGRTAEKFHTTDPFTPTGLKVLYVLLAYPELRQSTYREIAKISGVGLGSVSRTMNSLLREGHLIKGPSGAIHVRDFRNLLERWELGYLETLRQRLQPSSWRVTTIDRETLLHSLPSDVLVGGEEAAAALTGYLKPETVTLHCDKRRQQDLRVELRLLPTSENADVHILSPLKPVDRYVPAGAHTEFALAHPILVRAELLSLGGDRLREVAGRLLEDVILREQSHAN